MGESRFERYVREQLKELTKDRRAELEKAYEYAKQAVDGKLSDLRKIADAGLKAINAKLDAAARKFGWHVDETAVPVAELTSFSSNCGKRYEEAATGYDYGIGQYYVNGEVRKAKKALDDFDAAVEKAATRLVVVKMDLGMKAEAFDRAMAEAVAKLLRK